MISVSEADGSGTTGARGAAARVDRDRRATHSEHRALGVLADRLGGLLARLAEGGSESAGVDALLEEFRRRVVVHLEAEEERGVLEHAAAREPRLARRVERLRLEHDELRRGVARLVAGPAGADWPGLHARFSAFRDVLHHHEQAENDVLHSAYREDLGGG